MNRKSLVLIGLSILALALYVAGINTGAYILLGSVLVVEMWFWIKLVKRNKTNKSEIK